MAGAPGIEPGMSVPKTDALPLGDAPNAADIKAFDAVGATRAFPRVFRDFLQGLERRAEKGMPAFGENDATKQSTAR